MKIFLKYVLKSMIEKKGRLVLLLIAISMSVALFVASSGVIELGIKAFTKPYIEAFENKNITVAGTNDEIFFSGDGLKEDGINNLVKEIYMEANYLDGESDDITPITVLGRENGDINDEAIIDGDLSDFTGEKCIISKRISDENNINKGDKISIVLAGVNKELEVCAISAPSSVFYTDTVNNFTIILPHEYLSSELGAEGKYNLILADSKGNLEDSIDEFNDANEDYEATKLFDEDEVKSQMSSITSMLYAMLVIVVLMSTIIIYGSFKLTVTERLPIIGTFLSQGATVGVVERILLLESAIYGVFGGILGDVFGIGILKLVNYLISPFKEYGIIEKLDIDPTYLILGFVFSIVLSVISSLIPVMRIRKLQVKEVILNNVNISMHIGWAKFIVGCILIIFSSIVAFVDEKIFINLSLIGVLTAIVGAILVYQKLVFIISKGLYKILRGRSKSLVFSLNNLRTSKVLLGNISLMIIALSSIFMISSLGTSIQDMLKGCYQGLNFNIDISSISTMRQTDEQAVDLIKKELEDIDGIDMNTYMECYRENVELNDKYQTITCIDEERYAEYNKYLDFLSDKNKDMYNDFKNEENTLIVSQNALKDIDKSVGDYVEVQLNGVSRDLKIIGTYDGKLYNMGYTIFMKNSTLENTFKQKGRSEIMVSTTIDEEEMKSDLNFLCKKYGVNIATKGDWNKNDQEDNKMIVDILSIFSYMAICIATLGVLNNIIIGFLQRKREIAVLTSVGMSKVKRNLMLLFESALSVIWAFAVTVPISLLVMKLLSKVTVLIELPMDVKMDYSCIPGYLLGTLLIVMIATVPVILKNKKLSIINELKYE